VNELSRWAAEWRASGSGHLTRNVFDRYNIIDDYDMADAGKRLEQYAQKRKQERAAKLHIVK
jgi:hypothetical protein